VADIGGTGGPPLHERCGFVAKAFGIRHVIHRNSPLWSMLSKLKIPPEEVALLNLVQASLAATPSPLETFPSSLDWVFLQRLASHHRLEPLLCYGLSRSPFTGIPSRVRAQWEAHRRHALYYSLLFVKALMAGEVPSGILDRLRPLATIRALMPTGRLLFRDTLIPQMLEIRQIPLDRYPTGVMASISGPVSIKQTILGKAVVRRAVSGLAQQKAILLQSQCPPCTRETLLQIDTLD